MFKGIGEIWKNFAGHTRSSRFCVILITLALSFIAAVITAFKPAFPFVPFAGIVNGLSLGSYILKSFGAGEKERRINGLEKK